MSPLRSPQPLKKCRAHEPLSVAVGILRQAGNKSGHKTNRRFRMDMRQICGKEIFRRNTTKGAQRTAPTKAYRGRARGNLRFPAAAEKAQGPRTSVCCHRHPETGGENPDINQSSLSDERVAAKKSFAEARRRALNEQHRRKRIEEGRAGISVPPQPLKKRRAHEPPSVAVGIRRQAGKFGHETSRRFQNGRAMIMWQRNLSPKRGEGRSVDSTDESV